MQITFERIIPERPQMQMIMRSIIEFGGVDIAQSSNNFPPSQPRNVIVLYVVHLQCNNLLWYNI